jgi:hypothetical protein
VLRQQIRNYYGDPLGTGTFGQDSYYAKEARRVARSGERYLAQRHRTHGTRAIVLDVDDTSLATWNYEIFSNWAYNPTTNATYVTGQLLPPVPGMVRMATTAEREGYAIFFLTGRPAAQEADTLGNLTADGKGVDANYPKPTTLRDGEDGLFTKPAVADYPDYLKAACAGDPERLVHHRALQVRDPRSHPVARLRHRGELRRPVQRPPRRPRRPGVQAAQPELLPALISTGHRSPAAGRGAIRRTGPADPDRPTAAGWARTPGPPCRRSAR